MLFCCDHAAGASRNFEQTPLSAFSSPLSSGHVSFIRDFVSTAISISTGVVTRAVCL